MSRRPPSLRRVPRSPWPSAAVGGALLLLATPPEGLVLSRGETVLATVAWRLDPGVRGADVALPAWGGTATADHGGRLLVRGDAAPWITP